MKAKLLIILFLLSACVIPENFVWEPQATPVPESQPEPISFPQPVYDEYLTPETLGNFTGAYYDLGNGEGKILCTTEVSCLHEVAHHKDNLLGWPSQSDEWRLEVDAFLNLCSIGKEHYFCVIKNYPGVYGNDKVVFYIPDEKVGEWGGYSENNAHIY